MENNIETDVQLEEFINTKEAEIEKLCAYRKTLNSKIYRLPKEKADKFRIKRDSLSAKIAGLRKELKTAKGVEKRLEEIKGKLEVIRADKEIIKHKNERMKNR